MANSNLRAVAESVGLTDVASIISSGNLVFQTPLAAVDVEAELEAAWPRELGFDSTTMVRSRDEIETLVDLNPFGDRTHGPDSYLLVTFAKHLLPPDLADSMPPADDIGLVGRTDRELFTVTDTTMRAAGLSTMAWLEADLGKQITSRTWLTIGRILKKMG